MLKSKWVFEVSQIIHWTLLFPILIVQDSLAEGYPQSNVKSVKIAAIFRIYRMEILSSLRLFFCLWSGSENPRVIGSIPIGGTILSGFSSSGRAPPCQGGGSGFEPRHSLQKERHASKRVFF